jgi:hypothetical protein
MADTDNNQPMQDEELSADELDGVAGGVVQATDINTNCGGNCGCGAAAD